MIRPESAERGYFRWMDNINDRCLSRQLWWGHQAPAYFIQIEGEHGDDSGGDLSATGRTEEEARKKAEEKFPKRNSHLNEILTCWIRGSRPASGPIQLWYGWISRLRNSISYLYLGDPLGYSLLPGCQDDHAWHQDDRQDSLPRSVLSFVDQRLRGEENVKVTW